MTQAFPQNSYDYDQPNAFAGMIADGYKPEVLSYRNSETTDIPFGIMVAQGTGEEDLKLMVAGAKAIGVLLHSHNTDQMGMTLALSSTGGLKGTSTAGGPGRGNVAREGRAYVLVEQTVLVTDPVYWRHTANGAGKLQPGAFRKDSDSSNAYLLNGARWIKGATTGNLAVLEWDLNAHFAGADAGADAALRGNLADVSNGEGASLVAIEDAASLLTAATVEAGIAELAKYEAIELADPGTGQAITVTRSATVDFTIGSAGAETNTLAIPTFLGQRMVLCAKTVGTGTRAVTAASAINQTGNTIMTFAQARDAIGLCAIKVGSALAWQVQFNDGVALS
jgi:hypothetical protein